MRKYRFGLDLQLFSEDMGAADAGVDVASDAGVQETEVSADETGVESEVAAEPDKQNNFEKAFAKRLAAKEAEWQSKMQEIESRYKDYDTYKEVADYIVESNRERGINDVMTLKEQIEMEKLQARAEKNDISPELQRRLETLETKAAKADEIEQQQQLQNWYTNFKAELSAFASEKGANADEIEAFMVENGLQNYQVAYKALRAEQLEQELAKEREEKENAKKLGVEEYLASKKAPRVEGSGTPGMVQEDTSKLSWNELRQRTLDRIRAQSQSS